jgi:hypothetical protein
MERAIQFYAQLRGTIDAQELKIILHGKGNRPSFTAGVAARAHFACKLRIVVRYQILMLFFQATTFSIHKHVCFLNGMILLRKYSLFKEILKEIFKAYLK